MTVDMISDRVRGIVLEHFPLARKKSISNEDGLLESGILDSLGVLDLVGYLEKEFDVSVADEELVPENFHSINCLARFVHSKHANARR